jgi:hypothetical protein
VKRSQCDGIDQLTGRDLFARGAANGFFSVFFFFFLREVLAKPIKKRYFVLNMKLDCFNSLTELSRYLLASGEQNFRQ